MSVAGFPVGQEMNVTYPDFKVSLQLQSVTQMSFDIADGQNSLNLPGERRKFGDKSPADLLRLKAAAGACLIAEPATLAEADAVLVTGRIASGQSGYGAGLDPFADTPPPEPPK